MLREDRSRTADQPSVKALLTGLRNNKSNISDVVANMEQSLTNVWESRKTDQEIERAEIERARYREEKEEEKQIDAMVGSKYLMFAMEERAKREILEARMRTSEDNFQETLKIEALARQRKEELDRVARKYERLVICLVGAMIEIRKYLDNDHQRLIGAYLAPCDNDDERLSTLVHAYLTHSQVSLDELVSAGKVILRQHPQWIQKTTRTEEDSSSAYLYENMTGLPYDAQLRGDARTHIHGEQHIFGMPEHDGNLLSRFIHAPSAKEQNFEDVRAAAIGRLDRIQSKLQEASGPMIIHGGIRDELGLGEHPENIKSLKEPPRPRQERPKEAQQVRKIEESTATETATDESSHSHEESSRESVTSTERSDESDTSSTGSGSESKSRVDSRTVTVSSASKVTKSESTREGKKKDVKKTGAADKLSEERMRKIREIVISAAKGNEVAIRGLEMLKKEHPEFIAETLREVKAEKEERERIEAVLRKAGKGDKGAKAELAELMANDSTLVREVAAGMMNKMTEGQHKSPMYSHRPFLFNFDEYKGIKKLDSALDIIVSHMQRGSASSSGASTTSNLESTNTTSSNEENIAKNIRGILKNNITSKGPLNGSPTLKNFLRGKGSTSSTRVTGSTLPTRLHSSPKKGKSESASKGKIGNSPPKQRKQRKTSKYMLKPIVTEKLESPPQTDLTWITYEGRHCEQEPSLNGSQASVTSIHSTTHDKPMIHETPASPLELTELVVKSETLRRPEDPLQPSDDVETLREEKTSNPIGTIGPKDISNELDAMLAQLGFSGSSPPSEVAESSILKSTVSSRQESKSSVTGGYQPEKPVIGSYASKNPEEVISEIEAELHVSQDEPLPVFEWETPAFRKSRRSIPQSSASSSGSHDSVSNHSADGRSVSHNPLRSKEVPSRSTSIFASKEVPAPGKRREPNPFLIGQRRNPERFFDDKYWNTLDSSSLASSSALDSLSTANDRNSSVSDRNESANDRNGSASDSLFRNVIVSKTRKHIFNQHKGPKELTFREVDDADEKRYRSRKLRSTETAVDNEQRSMISNASAIQNRGILYDDSLSHSNAKNESDMHNESEEQHESSSIADFIEKTFSTDAIFKERRRT